MQFTSIWPIDTTLSGTTTPSQSGPGSDGKEWVPCIPGTSLSDYLESYQDTRWRRGVLPLCRGEVDGFYSPSRLCNFVIGSSYLCGWRLNWINFNVRTLELILFQCLLRCMWHYSYRCYLSSKPERGCLQYRLLGEERIVNPTILLPDMVNGRKVLTF